MQPHVMRPRMQRCGAMTTRRTIAGGRVHVGLLLCHLAVLGALLALLGARQRAKVKHVAHRGAQLLEHLGVVPVPGGGGTAVQGAVQRYSAGACG